MVTGDVGFILMNGAIMLGITLVQIACSIAAVYFGARTAMGLGRDLRGAIFTRVGEFSEREVSKFGAPSLITRTTNDVQQVQMLVLMTCTMLDRDADPEHRRRDLRAAAPTCSCPGSSSSRCPCCSSRSA